MKLRGYSLDPTELLSGEDESDQEDLRTYTRIGEDLGDGTGADRIFTSRGT
jgi:hypothetical protein